MCHYSLKNQAVVEYITDKLVSKLLYVTIFGKTDHLRAFRILRNTNLKYLMHCAFPVAQYSHARYLA